MVADPATATNGLTREEKAALRNKLKNKKKKERKKKKKPIVFEQQDDAPAEMEIEYVAAELNMEDPDMAMFTDVFNKYMPQPEKVEEKSEEDVEPEPEASSESESSSDKEEQISRKKLKKLKRLTVAELKNLVKRPDVVEVHDVTAADPKLLVNMKAYRNTVAVPRHWSLKRKYLQGKRGIEKPPFALPDFIEATGIGKARDVETAGGDAGKTLKQKARDRMHGKTGKLDIDYQVLHDAFFRYQTKPRLTWHGDMYYEGKEFEVDMKECKPGQLSDELKTALSMPSGAPPPWLINMQRYGPPPSYPALKIPGLNAPIPNGASFGYHPGGWGRPPVDEYGRPLYGDVFGTASDRLEPTITAPIERSHWAVLPDEEEESSEEEEEEEGEGDLDLEEKTVDDGTISMVSTLSGMETPETIELRKTAAGMPALGPDGYAVVQQVDNTVGGAFMGSSHKYVIPGQQSGTISGTISGTMSGTMSGVTSGVSGTQSGTMSETRPMAVAKPGVKVHTLKSQKTAGVVLTLNPEELDNLDDAQYKAKYEEQMQAEKAANRKEDLSDMVDEELRRQARKRKAKEQAGDPKAKRTKDSFKF